MMHSEQLERQAEASRGRLSDRLEELRECVTPGDVVHQLVDYARQGAGGEFMRNLGVQVRRNPLPVALIGAGMAWLMMGNGARRPYELERRSADGKHGAMRNFREKAAATGAELGERTQEAASAIGDAATAATNRASEIAETVSSKAAALSDNASKAWSGALDAATGTAQRAGDSAASMGRRAASISRSFGDFCAEQPAILGGLGLAVGAALGAAIPGSEAEDRLMGDTSDEFKDRVQQFAADTADKAAAMTAHETAAPKTGHDRPGDAERAPPL